MAQQSRTVAGAITMARLTEEELRLIEIGNINLWEKCGFSGPIKDIRVLIAEVKACWEINKPADKEFYWQKKEGDK